MAEAMLDVGSRQIDRTELAQFLPTQRLIVAFENFQAAVASDTPSQVNANTTAIAETNVQVADLESMANAARSAADGAVAALAQLTIYIMTRRDDRARLAAMQREIDELKVLVLGA